MSQRLAGQEWIWLNVCNMKPDWAWKAIKHQHFLSKRNINCEQRVVVIHKCWSIWYSIGGNLFLISLFLYTFFAWSCFKSGWPLFLFRYNCNPLWGSTRTLYRISLVKDNELQNTHQQTLLPQYYNLFCLALWPTLTQISRLWCNCKVPVLGEHAPNHPSCDLSPDWL